jgi:hypothetical protein
MKSAKNPKVRRSLGLKSPTLDIAECSMSRGIKKCPIAKPISSAKIILWKAKRTIIKLSLRFSWVNSALGIRNHWYCSNSAGSRIFFCAANRLSASNFRWRPSTSSRSWTFSSCADRERLKKEKGDLRKVTRTRTNCSPTPYCWYEKTSA